MGGLPQRALPPPAPTRPSAEHCCPACYRAPPACSGRFLQVAGISFVFDPATKTVVSAHLSDGRRLFGPAGADRYGRYRHSRAYTGDVLVATTNFLADGGDE